MRIHPWLAVAVFVVSALSGCAPTELPSGEWTGYASIADSRLLPFRFEVDLTQTTPTGAFLVGDERTPIPEISVRGDSLIFEISEYNAEMSGVYSGGRWSGRYHRFRSDTTGFPFVAFPVVDEVSEVSGSHSQPFSGSFRTYIHRESGIDSVSTARFWTEGDRVLGTVIHPSGDWGLLEGAFDGDSLRLGRLTGWQAIFVELGRSERGWSGRRYVRENPPIDIEFRPLRAGEEIVPTEITTMKYPEKPFTFSGVTLQGDTLTSSDERFQGAPIVVDIMGTWCHNCMDAVPILNRLYNEYRDEGLQLVSLSFELTDDAEDARRDIGLFVDRYDIEYPVLFCGDIGAENVERRLKSQLENFFAYPSTILVGRDGLVKDIHVGFNGLGTGEELYRKQIEELESAVRKIVGRAIEER